MKKHEGTLMPALLKVIKAHPKLSAALLASGVVQGINHESTSADIYRESRRIHAAQVQALKMDWGNPLPFESEILTKWGSRGEAYRAEKFGSPGQHEKGARHVSR
ncbi:MAG: hypothetical protein JST16_11930 [Bdellovibrionales bacterium]|nr:hypothetical protein [Bdellovibrionales bacterium]